MTDDMNPTMDPTTPEAPVGPTIPPVENPTPEAPVEPMSSPTPSEEPKPEM